MRLSYYTGRFIDRTALKSYKYKVNVTERACITVVDVAERKERGISKITYRLALSTDAGSKIKWI